MSNIFEQYIFLIKRHIKLVKYRAKWQNQNSHNKTTLHSITLSGTVDLANFHVGNNTYGPLNLQVYDTSAKLSIGHYCSIADNCVFLLGGEHDYHRISLYPFQTRIYSQPGQKKQNKDICVGDDVWIGYGCVILAGVTIGQGSVIGANSIVTKDVPPYSIYVGNQVTHRRFEDDEIIEKLLKIDFSNIHHSKGDEYEGYCQTDINAENIDMVIEKFTK